MTFPYYKGRMRAGMSMAVLAGLTLLWAWPGSSPAARLIESRAPDREHPAAEARTDGDIAKKPQAPDEVDSDVADDTAQGNIAVLVVDSSGRPVADASIDLLPREGPSADTPIQAGWIGLRTGSDGRVLVLVERDRDYDVSAEAGGRISRAVPIAAGMGEQTLVLLEPASVRGRLVPADIPVHVLTSGPRLLGDSSFDPMGTPARFEFEGLAPGPHVIRASSPDIDVVSMRIVLQPGEVRSDLILRLDPKPKSYLTLRAVDENGPVARPRWTTAPAFSDYTPGPDSASSLTFDLPPGSTVRVLRPGAATLRTTAKREPAHEIRIRPAVRFRTPNLDWVGIEHAQHLGGDEWIHREAPGTLLFWEATRGAREGRGWLVAPRRGEAVELELPELTTIRGRLVDTAGAPVPGRIEIADPRLIAQHDVRGAFEVSASPVAPVELSIFDADGILVVRTRHRAGARTIDAGTIVVPRRVTVHGTVRDASGRPAGGVAVSVIDAKRGLLGWTRSSADGRFVVAARVGAQWITHAQHPDGRAALARNHSADLVLAASGWIADGRVFTADGIRIETKGTGSPLALPPGEYTAGDPPRHLTVRAGEVLELD